MRKMINRKGSTLALTIIIFAVLMIFVTFTLGFMVTENKQAMYHQNKVKAYYSARSGAEIAEAAIIDYLSQNYTNHGLWTGVNDFITSLKAAGESSVSISEGVEGLGEVKIYVVTVDEKEIIRIDSNATINNIQSKVSKLLFTDVTRVAADVSKTGGAPLIAVNGAGSIVKKDYIDLTGTDNEYGIPFAEKLTDNNLFPDYVFPDTPLVQSFSMDDYNEVYDDGTIIIDGLTIDDEKHYSGTEISMSGENVLNGRVNIYGNLNATGNTLINSDLSVSGNMILEGNLSIGDGSSLRVNGNLIMNGSSSITAGNNSSIIINGNLTIVGSNIELVLNEGSKIHINNDIISYSGSILEIRGNSSINIKNDFLVNGDIYTVKQNETEETELLINVLGRMEITSTSNSFNGGVEVNPKNMTLHVFNENNIVKSLIIVPDQYSRTIGNFYVKSGITEVVLDKAYFEGNIISNTVYSINENYYTDQENSTVRVTTPDSSNKTTFKGSVYAKKGFVLLGGSLLPNDKISLEQSGLVVGSYILVQGLNDTQTDKSYLIDVFDNLQTSTVTIPVQLQNKTTISSVDYSSIYIDSTE